MSEAILTTLSYSAGAQSHALLKMVLLGHISRPKNFLVLNADPGMEDSRTYGFVNLSHADNPPLWTKNRVTGKVAKLKQSCTPFYKIAPIRRAMRTYMEKKFGIPIQSTRIPQVVTWIGFAADESDRAKRAAQNKKNPKYNLLEFPLIELGMDRDKVDDYYAENRIDKPPRSVCNACFANGLRYFEDMYHHRPDDWDKAVSFDDSVRDMTKFGVKDECFVSSTCIPLRDLPTIQFKKSEADYLEHRCNSGACFI